MPHLLVPAGAIMMVNLNEATRNAKLVQCLTEMEFLKDRVPFLNFAKTPFSKFIYSYPLSLKPTDAWSLL